MKHLFKTSITAIIVTVAVIGFSSFNTKSETISNAVAAYEINLQTKQAFADNADGSLYVWEWQLTNPNPGNGSDGTLQDLSHWSIPLSPTAEAALVSAEYSTDGGITWISVSIEMDRDPAIRVCTGEDVLKFDVGTSGTQPNLYRVTFDTEFEINALATSYVKTGGGVKGCNLNYYAGVGGQKLF